MSEPSKPAFPPFVPGLELAQELAAVVAPIIRDRFAGLPYSAALIGPGSDVLGFDTTMSMDHDWGPRLLLFVADDTAADLPAAIERELSAWLPATIRGFPAHFGPADDADGGTRVMTPLPPGATLAHRVVVARIGAWLEQYLGFDPRTGMDAADWLTTPSQKLRSIVAGAVFHDDAGLGAIRERLAWYPPDIHRYLLASSWSRIGEDDHLLGRAGTLGDETGARVLAGRLAHEAMRACFLLEREYAPYAKWLGTGFARLDSNATVGPLVERLLDASGAVPRDDALMALLERLAELQNASDLADEQEPRARRFFGRPYRVIDGSRFSRALVERIEGEEVRKLAARRLIGGIDHVSDNTDLLEDVSRQAALRALYTSGV